MCEPPHLLKIYVNEPPFSFTCIQSCTFEAKTLGIEGQSEF